MQFWYYSLEEATVCVFEVCSIGVNTVAIDVLSSKEQATYYITHGRSHEGCKGARTRDFEEHSNSKLRKNKGDLVLISN